jgi:hypothetical protein
MYEENELQAVTSKLNDIQEVIFCWGEWDQSIKFPIPEGKGLQ